MKTASSDYGDEQAFRVAYLISGYIRKKLTEAEHDELDAWVEASDENMKLFEDLTDEANIEANLAFMDGVQTEKALHKAQASVFGEGQKRKKVRTLWPYLAAASVVVAAITTFLLWPGKQAVEPSVVSTTKFNDASPGGNKAVLRLSDGSLIDLSKVGVGTISAENGLAFSKQDTGSIAYSSSSNQPVLYHTLETPIGGQYHLTLPDGTQVWLNAQSSLRFPTRFDGSTRNVELQGQGYFEVAKNAERPFVVKLADNEEIQVLGTVFDASAYSNDGTKKVTLLEGKVQVAARGQTLILRPNQQAVLSGTMARVIRGVDVEAATGWKRGQFVFEDADIQTVMQQVQRWYDVGVTYQTKTSEHFNFTVSRNEPLSKLLRLMELTDKIHFTIKNKTVYVQP